ncbi:hypothetical protein OS175_01860 [Marinicella sp. S1101]|uniref:hypothetical protein n=1 Tax=Marinicella marina TaxID=2996016 RepID=UPI002260B15B|nr:hypothetical protein [Marinicella marina]MCX7552609.1 hypothetical protein [Marinicella marina]MDJ1139485.1 hypothetical protein [Marinicella marina]
MYSNQLLNELGLLNLKLKQNNTTTQMPVTDSAPPVSQQQTPSVSKPVTPPKMDKNEFRLLVKMLKAIGHDCVFDAIAYDGKAVKYSLSEVTLIFDDINTPDTATTTHLASLHDILADDSLKRPVWEKLKTLKT